MTEIIVKTKSGRKPSKTKVGRDDTEKISPKRQALGEKKRRDDSSDGRKAEGKFGTSEIGTVVLRSPSSF